MIEGTLLEKKLKEPLTTYLSLCTEYYDLEPHKDAALALDFYMSYAKEAHGPVLEPMCGTGRFLLPMLDEGIDIEGFDASPHMLHALREKYKKLFPNTQKEAPVWQQFVQEFSSDKLYALIFIPYGSWGLITQMDDIKISLEKMYNSLAPGGKFVIEIETVSSVPEGLGVWHRGIHIRENGTKIALNTFPTYNSTTQIFKAVCHYESFSLSHKKDEETEDFYMYLYRAYEMDALLKNVGFLCIKKYQDFLKTPLISSCPPIILYECIKE